MVRIKRLVPKLFSHCFSYCSGKSFWDYLGEEPSVLGDIFNDALASDSRFNTNVLITECKHMFEGLTSLVDVGGGTGTMPIAISKAFPNIKCTALDLPHVVRDCKRSGNLDFVGGDISLSFDLPSQLIHHINTIPLPLTRYGPDTPLWASENKMIDAQGENATAPP
ncbi:hypothetical protein RND71_007763 [Anisodus tanguticus]|uniref:O-methyltransferase C-terminal domain-containing protein n=1 Tax=Anisodus tanguticus TaxID=243964 RepID=A0AAE1SME6_9SOLA|nr:hypothetical protein RND71_007763 [Anisodus tanguticus]